jgi:hypothetical protein
VNSKYESDQGEYWAPAKRTAPELDDRYKVAIRTLKHCVEQQQTNNTASRSVSVTMSRSGIPIDAAEPGDTIMLQVQVQDAGPGPLHYSWTSQTVSLAATDTASVVATLPENSGQPVVNVEITNSKGGLLSGSITVPLQTAPAPESAAESKVESASASRPALVFKILTDNGML